MSEDSRRTLSAEDLYRLEMVTDCQISPDGQHIVFCLERVDRNTEKKHANLWIAPSDGEGAWPFTAGDHADTHPRWSPDGRQIAFLSNRGDEKQKQIYLIPFYGGEAQRVTDLKGEFATFEWSRDGRRLVCQFRKKDQEVIEREEDEQKKKLGRISRRYTRAYFKFDGVGYLPQERWHIWTIDVQTGEARQITTSDVYDELSPRWSPDSQEIAFLSNRSPSPDLDPEAIGLYVIPSTGGPVREIETPVGRKQQLSFSPDGRWLAYFGREGRGDWWKNESLWIVPADGAGSAKNLTAQYDIHLGNGTLGDVADWPTLPAAWSPDGRRLMFQVTRHGNTTLQTVSVAGDDLEAVTEAKGVVGAFSVDEKGSKVAYCYCQPLDPSQIWLRDLDGSDNYQLTNINKTLFQEIKLGEIEEVWFKGAAENDLQGWIFKPPDFGEARRYPSILEIHGGPRLQYGNLFMYEFHFLAANGYVVYFSNPRGGQGYGEQHSKSIENAWGTVDYDDLNAWADLVEQKSYVDAERMGVTGGSYGGYMTSWIIGHTDRFEAAVAQRVVSNLISMWGSSDLNWAFQNAFGGKPPWENFDNFWRQSPMKYIGNAKTPTLVIHSERDMRCDLEQGLQLFVALQWLGVESELVLFPEEPHGLPRIGRTDRRIDRLNHILRWFDRYLKNLS